LLESQSRYVSDTEDVFNIHARKVVMTAIDLPYMGRINIFSAHLSWWENGFRQQFQRLRQWAESLQTEDVNATLLCGDFNITVGSEGYREVVEHSQYQDQYLIANGMGLYDDMFRVNDAHWQNYSTDEYRIDYIFMTQHSRLRVATARVLFTEWDYGQVSDHCGYLMTFEPQ
jgi:maltose 6'-phosphate phosphatase